MVIQLSYILINILCIMYTNSQIIIKDAGISRIQPNDIGMIFYLTLENVCQSRVYISVRGVRCCEYSSESGISDCDSMKLIGGDPGLLYAGVTKNVTLIYPNLYLTERQGVCTVLVVFKTGKRTKHFFHKIPFSTKGQLQGFPEKTSPCYTTDLNPYKNCSPVDCPIKYSGFKNYFNTRSKHCEPVPVCQCPPGQKSSGQMYDILHNKCADLDCSVSQSDLMLIEEKSVTSKHFPYIMGNMICHHGQIDKRTGECICDEKWISTATNEPEFSPTLISSHMCNIRTGSWTELNKDKLLLAVLVMMVMVSLCVLKLFLLIFILHFCYKWARSRAERSSLTLQLGLTKKYGSSQTSNHTCYCPPTPTKKQSKSSQKSLRSQRSHTCTCEMVRTQSAWIRTKKSEKNLQFGNLDKCPTTIGVIANIECVCKGNSNSNNTARSISMSHRDARSDEDEALKSDSSSSSACSCKSERGRFEIEHFTTTFHSSVEMKKVSESTETRTSNSSFSINLDYDTEDLELECSSSSSSHSGK